MPNTAVGINPALLRWARSQAALSLEEVAGRLHKDSADIERWEDGETAPTYVQLERLAYEVYKRPIAVFFLPEPPVDLDPQNEFRTLPEEQIRSLSAQVRLAIREGLARRLSLEELCAGRNPTESPIFREFVVAPGDDPAPAALTAREILGIDLEEQIRWRSAREALDKWRNAVERAGIFVFKRSIKQRAISGFCLADDEFPLIVINNSTPKTRQIFTLFHELAHVLRSASGITFRDDRFIHGLAGQSREIEVFCNRFAAEALVPSGDFAQYEGVRDWTDEQVEAIADRYSVSRESILRRALDWGRVSQEYYHRKAAEWAAQTSSGRSDGGDFYATQTAYYGESYLSLVFSHHQRGRLSSEDLPDHLGMKAETAMKLEDYFLGRANAV